MRSRSVPARVALILATVSLLAPWYPMIAARAATDAPTVTVTPDTDLSDPFSDGQYVTVSWKGFPPDALVGAKECVRGATSLAQCSRPNLYSSCGFLCPGEVILGTSDSRGNGSGSLPVANGLVNVEQDRTTDVPGYTFRCDADHPCDLWVTTDTLDLTKGVFAPIEFQPPTDSCAGGSGQSLSGSGGAPGIRQFRTYAVDLCHASENVDLEYVWGQKVSATAMDDYIAGASDFAVSSVPMSAFQRTTMDAAGRTAGYAPILGTGEVFGFRIYDSRNYNQLTKLTLTPELLARIFSGQIKQWNIPAIKRLNPSAHLPATIAVIGRGDSCEENLNVTRWFWSAARGAWRDGGRGVRPALDPYTGPSDILPSLATAQNPVTLLTGSQSLASTVRTGGPDYASITQYGTIGYMDSSVAEQYGLPTVRIKYPNGKTVAATPGTIRRAIGAMHPTDTGVARPDYATESPGQWPMPVVSYMVIPHGASKSDAPPDKATGDAIADVVRYIVGTGQHGLARGYTQLPAAYVAQARTMANQLWNAPPEPPDSGDDPGIPPVNGNQPPGSNQGPVTNFATSPPPFSQTPSSIGPTTTEQPPPSSVPTVPGLVLPQSALAATPWSKALPTATIFGLASLILGVYLLLGQRVRTGLALTAAKVRTHSPLRRRRGRTPDRPDEGRSTA